MSIDCISQVWSYSAFGGRKKIEFPWSCLTSIKVIIFHFHLDYLNNGITYQLPSDTKLWEIYLFITFVTIIIGGFMVEELHRQK